jgi:hypothetical protein
MRKISINRAPVLTLWAAIVAEHLGFDEDAAQTLGKALAGLNAQAKGRRLGILKPQEQSPGEDRAKGRGEEFWVELCGRHVPARKTEHGVRAVRDAQIIGPESVHRYLAEKFGSDLGAVRAAMHRLARSFGPAELAENAFLLYERFRPAIPDGARGWGAKGTLDLDLIEGLVKTSRSTSDVDSGMTPGIEQPQSDDPAGN